MSAPQVTVADIQGKIKNVSYTILPDCTTTICQITLENGFTVIGKSACVNLAFEDAANKIWELEGYLLKERIYQESKRV